MKSLLKQLKFDRTIWSWALYDWANSAFATTVMAVFFPVFFKNYWAGDLSVNESSFHLGWGNSLAALFIAFTAPLLGALADRGGKRKSFLKVFMLLGVITTIGLFFVPQNSWFLAVTLFVLSTIGFAGANIFYDSLLVSITTKDKFDLVSGFGFALGYLGGAILLVVNVFMTLKPELFGFADKAEAVRWSFLTVGVWWLVFSIPLFLYVNEDEAKGGSSKKWIREGVQTFIKTLKHIRQYRELFIFLIAYLFYIDGVNTIIKMAVDFGLAIGLKTDDLIAAIVMTNFVGFPAALFFGWLGGRIGAKPGIFICLAAYFVSSLIGAFISEAWHFFVMAFIIGLVQGGVQSLSRSYFSQMVPRENASEFFGFFNTLGKFSAILGPFLVGFVSQTTGSARASIVVVIAFISIGALILTQVKSVQPKAVE